jgi:hypothetical protein
MTTKQFLLMVAAGLAVQAAWKWIERDALRRSASTGYLP